MAQVIQLRRGSAAVWTSEDTVLAQGEVGFELDTYKFKIGDGATAWSSLAYFSSGAGGGAVDSVNTQTGDVVLDADDISDASTTKKFTTAARNTKVDGIEAGADVTDAANVTSAGAAMNSQNLSGLANVATARTNLGLGALAVKGSLIVPHDVYFSIPADAVQGDFSTIWEAPRPGTVSNYHGQVSVAPAAAAILIDLNKNGTTMNTVQSTRVNIAIGTLRDQSGTPAVTSFVAGDLIQFEIDQLNAADVGDIGIITIRFTWLETIT